MLRQSCSAPDNQDSGLCLAQHSAGLMYAENRQPESLSFGANLLALRLLRGRNPGI